MLEINKPKVLSCGHPTECEYFHPALKGSYRWRCIACDDPKGNTVAVQELIKKGVLNETNYKKKEQ